METFVILAGIFLLLAGLTVYALGYTTLYRDSDDSITYKIVSVIFVIIGLTLIW